MSRILCFAVCILQILIFVHATGLYSIVAPGTIRSNFKYNVAASVHKADGPCQMKIGISSRFYNEEKTVDIQPMTTQTIVFDVPTLMDGDYNLTAVGVSGITFENSTRLNYADYKLAVFIQTDKATYKPGDLVQYRIMFLDENARPAKIQSYTTIFITDGAQNRIKQLQDIELTKGVYSGQFQLSEQPVLGIWTIEVMAGNVPPDVKTFEVAKYVLPKFDVAIETANDVAIADGVIKITVRSKYTYGKSVKGKATISLKPSYHYYGNSDDKLEAEKTIDVDGKGHVEFDLKNDLRLADGNSYVPPLRVLAVMEEELTGNKQNTTATINLHTDRYRIEGIDTPNTYHPGKPITIKVVVKNVDGSPVRDTKNSVKLVVEPPKKYFHRALAQPEEGGTIITTTEDPEEKNLEYESKLNEHGMASFEFTLPENNKTFFSVRCQFIDTTSYITSLSKYTKDIPESLKLSVNTKKPQLGKEVSVDVTSREAIPYLVYTIVARGNIIKSEHVELPADSTEYTIKFTPTFEMIPKTTVFVHYILNNDLRFEETVINFEKEFENSIDIEAQAQAKPGEDVKLKIKTTPDSYVGLLGVDQSVLLLKSGNDFSKDQIFDSLSSFDTSTPWMRGYGRYPGQSSGVVTLTNANYAFNNEFPFYHLYQSAGMPVPVSSVDTENYSSAGRSTTKIEIRRDFKEIWLFNDIENSDTDTFTLDKKIPDTITSWVITGFSLNPKTGVALTDNPTKIQVFQPFFVSTNLPYSVKRGEVIAIPVIIFNYMEKSLDAEVTMDNEDKEFEFTEATNEVIENPIDEVKRVKRVTIPSNTGKSISFMIRPKKVGPITLKISAVTPLAGDAIHQTLKVEPEGVTQYANRAVFVDLNAKSEHKEKISVDMPPEIVPDSEYIELSVVGDLLGPTLKNLDKLVRMPYGCGEQNMVNFVPNILVLKYLAAIKKEMPSITEKAIKFLEIGYQRELTYKHDDGSYSAFGKSDKFGSTWLTAYVVRSFNQASKFIDIDGKVIAQGLNFLASKQAENGSFPEYGKLFDSSHQNELGLTAFVLLAFFENKKLIEKYRPKVDKAIKYLEENIEKSDDQYSLALAASALQIAKNPAAEKVLAKLQTLAKRDSDRKWWSKEVVTTPEEQASWYWRPRSNDVETTAYVLIALLEKESAESTLPIIKWLISQRNSNGGFESTQDTVVGLQALIKFAEKTGSGSGEMDIDFVSTGGSEDKGNIKVNSENSLVLQTHVLPRSTRQVEFTAKGKGSSMVQLSYRYNIAEKEKKPSFAVKTNVKDNTTPQQLFVDVCAEYTPSDEGKNKESNMAVMEIALPSGYTADVESFERIESVDRVKRIETKNSDSTLIVYFDSLTVGDKKCIPVEASKIHAVAKQKPAAVSIYDYYDTGRRATEYYEVKSSLCDICEGDDCGSGCKKQ